MRELAEALARFDRAGPVARAVVLATWGSAPRPPGASLLLAADGRVEGSVSGGCVENAVIAELEAARASGRPKRLRYEVSDETAWSVGLACGGTIEVLVEPAVTAEVRSAMCEVRGAVVVGTLDDGRRWVVTEEGQVTGPGEFPAEERTRALDSLRGERSVLTDSPHPALRTSHLFFESIPRAPELCIIGAGHVAQELVPLAKRLGFTTKVFDPRATFLTRERFPDADQMIQGWPAEELPKHLGPGSFVSVLSHDPKFDEPCVRLALRSPARYVGVIGSRKNQEKRR
ncbi:MAG TPA: XdhC family protein, partial [Gemmatimonadales bacterium]|nr:XdhC family protein [Gemmatimonadales bacterium]